jgi:hypothetical protein
MDAKSALSALQVSASQLENAKVIVSEFVRAGLPAGVGLAAVTNAMAESALNTNAVGDGGNSVGLFQINALGGARTFDGDRRDPRYNAQWITDEYKRYRSKKGRIGTYNAVESLDEAYDRGASVAEMAGLFAAIVERPRDQYGEKSRREAMARSMFGAFADLPANRVTMGVSVVAVAGITVASIAILAGGYFAWRYYRGSR